jgi:hypothetical protein
MTDLDSSVTFLPPEEIDAAARDELTVTLRLVGRDPVAVGRFLDLVEHLAPFGGIECTVDAPGYRQAFYGWEKARTP